MKKISILGSTGSIGTQSLEVIDGLGEDYQVVALAGGSNLPLLVRQINKYRPHYVSVPSQDLANDLRDLLVSESVTILYGKEGSNTLAALEEVDIVIAAMVGIAGLDPLVHAIKSGKTIALANKEALVVSGELIKTIAHQYQAHIIPVDSEHSAIFQSLAGQSLYGIKKMILTGSGGPFREWSSEKIHAATVDEALNHPVWSMGKKITIDSATLMNKAFEVIEAHFLFNMPYDQIEVVIHPEGIVHSAVEFIDGAIIAQMGIPSMHLPIQYALTYPDRSHGLAHSFLDLCKEKTLTFLSPDTDRFPCLKLGHQVGKEGGILPAVLNGANEVVVDAFLKKEIAFKDIFSILERSLNTLENRAYSTLEEVFDADSHGRHAARSIIDTKVNC